MAMSILEQIRAEKKARDARIAAAAMKVQQQVKPVALVRKPAPEADQDNRKPEAPKVYPRILPVVVYKRPIGPNRLSFEAGAAPEFIPEVEVRKSWRDIAAEVCRKHNQPWDLIKSDRRYPDLMPCRQELYYRLHRETKFSLGQIGKLLGGRDHSTILSGIRQHKRRLDTGENLVIPAPTERAVHMRRQRLALKRDEKLLAALDAKVEAGA